jgi:hypothetical protein
MNGMPGITVIVFPVITLCNPGVCLGFKARRALSQRHFQGRIGKEQEAGRTDPDEGENQSHYFASSPNSESFLTRLSISIILLQHRTRFKSVLIEFYAVFMEK